ncbi:MAG: S9 family peptidase, partial [Oceanicaulis sp.]
MRFALLAAASAAVAACTPAEQASGDLARQTAPDPTPEAALQDGPAAPVYPATRTVDQTDVYVSASRGEVSVADPYRWLEADVRESEAVAEWVLAQNYATNAYLDALPGRGAFAERLAELWNYERFGLPDVSGGRYFFTRNDGLQDQSVLVVADALDAEPRVLIDPNAWSEDGTTALAAYEPSPDGTRLAYMVQAGGSDWRTIRVIDTASGEALSDEIEWVKFSPLSWAKDGSGFFYSRYPEPEAGAAFTALNMNQAIYFHEIGAEQSEDRLILEDPERPEVGWRGQVSDDGRYLVVSSSSGTDGNAIHVVDLEAPDTEPVAIFEGFANNHLYVGNTGETFHFHTDLDAPNGRIVSLDLSDPAALSDVVAEGADVITGADHVGGRLIVERMRDVASAVEVYETDGTLVRTVELPGLGVASGFSGSPDRTETFYAFESLNRAPTLYRYDVATGESTL